MNYFIQTLLVIVLFAATVGAQSSQFTQPCVGIELDRNVPYYSRNAKKALKNGDPIMAAVYAAHYLAKAEKRKHIRKAGELLPEMLTAAANTPDQLTELRTSSSVVKGERELRDRQSIHCQCHKRQLLRTALDAIPEDKLQNAGATTLAGSFPDYTEETNLAVDSVDAAAGRVSYLYLRLAHSIPLDSTRASALKKLKRCDQALHFNPHNQAAKAMASELRTAARGIYELAPVRNVSKKNLGQDVLPTSFGAAMLLQNHPKYFSKKRAGEKANIRIAITLTSGAFERKKNEPYTKERSQEIDGKTYKAKYISYSKSTYATVKYSYSIIDVQTGEALSSGSNTVVGEISQSWASYTGSLKALSKSQRKKLKSEPQWSSPNLAFAKAMTYVASKVASSTAVVFTSRGTWNRMDEFPTEVLQKDVAATDK